MLREMIEEAVSRFMPSPAQDARKVAKSGGAGAIGGAGKMNPNNKVRQAKFVPTPNDPEYYATRGATNEAEAQRMVNEYREKMYPGVKPLFDNFEQRKKLSYKLPGGGTSQFNPNSVTNAGNLTPRYEDGYDTTIKYLQGNLGRGSMPMDMDTVPTNFTAGRTGYFQGSNPYVNGRNWVNPQYQELGDGIQSPSFGARQPRNRY